MGNLETSTKLIILSLASSLCYYIYSPSGMNYIRLTKFIRSMPSNKVNSK